ncbi:universal stress protein [Rhizophagus clarus]|uniref:Universal stress protein n=1 Tax=Rhizophagus clarus TaxID=94130 RepID=A0A8H3KVC2_9GLOM|nr:universal stress protein [Rhizophagus clarus]
MLSIIRLELCIKKKKRVIIFFLTIIYVIALNPETNVPFLHNLDKANNLDILLDAEEAVGKIREYLKKFDNTYPDVQYDFIEHKGYGIVGKILTEYISQNQLDLDLLIVGSRNLDGLQKVVLSSTSDYLARHVHCPVTIVKQ